MDQVGACMEVLIFISDKVFICQISLQTPGHLKQAIVQGPVNIQMLVSTGSQLDGDAHGVS